MCCAKGCGIGIAILNGVMWISRKGAGGRKRKGANILILLSYATGWLSAFYATFAGVIGLIRPAII
jgi:hypothetical protein